MSITRCLSFLRHCFSRQGSLTSCRGRCEARWVWVGGWAGSVIPGFCCSRSRKKGCSFMLYPTRPLSRSGSVSVGLNCGSGMGRGDGLGDLLQPEPRPGLLGTPSLQIPGFHGRSGFLYTFPVPSRRPSLQQLPPLWQAFSFGFLSSKTPLKYRISSCLSSSFCLCTNICLISSDLKREGKDLCSAVCVQLEITVTFSRKFTRCLRKRAPLCKASDYRECVGHCLVPLPRQAFVRAWNQPACADGAGGGEFWVPVCMSRSPT